MRNPSLTQIVTLTQILTPFLASQKCHYYEWTNYLSFFYIYKIFYGLTLETFSQQTEHADMILFVDMIIIISYL